MEETKEKKTFNPSTNTVVVKPIMRTRNPNVTDPEHEAYFLFGNSTIGYDLPLDRQGNLHNPFESLEEQAWLEKRLDVDLNIYKRKDNYWKTFKVYLGKNEKKLNLSNPKDYIDWLVLKANKMYIAPDGKSMNNRQTYRYALVNEEFDVKVKVSASDKRKKAYKAAGKLEEGGKEAMLNFLKVFGKRVSEGSKTDFLVATIDDLIMNDIDRFLEIADDRDNYEIRLLIADAVECGAVKKDGRKYTLPGGDNLSAKGDQPTMENVILYLQAPGNQDILTLLKTRVQTAKD